MKIKRVFVAVLAALTLSASAVSLAACGGNSASSTAPSASASSAATSSAAAGKYASIEEIIQIPEFQNQLNSLRSSVSSMGVDLRVRAEGSTLVYEYQLAETVSDERKQYLMTQMNSADGVTTFTNIVKELKNRTTVSNPTVIVRYLDKDGRTAVEKTYTENTEPVADYEMGSPGGAYSSPAQPDLPLRPLTRTLLTAAKRRVPAAAEQQALTEGERSALTAAKRRALWKAPNGFFPKFPSTASKWMPASLSAFLR